MLIAALQLDNLFALPLTLARTKVFREEVLQHSMSVWNILSITLTVWEERKQLLDFGHRTLASSADLELKY